MNANLPPRQQEIMVMIVKGANDDQMSEKLGVTRNTLLNHRKRMYRKLGVRNRCQLAGIAMVKEWVPMRPIRTEKSATVSYPAKRVLALIARGMTNPEIEKLLGITVRPLLNELYEKLETRDRLRLVTRGFRAGLWTHEDIPPVWTVAVPVAA